MSSIAHVQAPDGNVSPRFTLNLVVPLDKDFLRELQRLAVNEKMALPTWGRNFKEDPAEEAVYFEEKEWCELTGTSLAPHRVDLYTIQRGLLKLFDVKYDIPIATRQLVLRALFEQHARPCILGSYPQAISMVIQLALFDQVIY